MVMNVGYPCHRDRLYSGRMKRLATGAVALTAMLVLAGCTAPTSHSTDSAGSPPAVGAPTVGTPAVGEGATPGRSPSKADRQVISTGTVSITADDPIGAADAAVKLIEGAGGRVDSRSEQPAPVKLDATSSVSVPDPLAPVGPAAQLVVRIPAASLTETLDAIKNLGTVQFVSITATDVTAQSQDLDARVAALRASVDRLLGLLTAATTTKDLIDIETALSSRQADLESLESQRRALSDQVELSTITVSFASSATAPTKKPSDFVSGVSVGWQTLISFLGGAIVVVGFLLPWLIAVGLVGCVVFVLVRRAARKRRAAFFAGNAAAAPSPVVDAEPASSTMEE